LYKATVVMRTRPSVMYVRRLSCLNYTSPRSGFVQGHVMRTTSTL